MASIVGYIIYKIGITYDENVGIFFLDALYI